MSSTAAGSAITIRAETRIGAIERAVWDGLLHHGSPFLRHGFLVALEDSGSIGRRSGWNPVYLLAEQEGKLLGAVAAFVKTHSYNEYIFN